MRQNTKKTVTTILIGFLLFATAIFAEQVQPSQEAIDSFHIKALQLKNEGKYQDAESIFKQILNAQPDNSNARFDLGNVYLLEKKYQEALDCYREVNRLSPDKQFDAAYYFNISMCFIGLGSYEKAINNLKQCIDNDPNYPDAQNLLGLVENAHQRKDILKIEKCE